MIAQGQGGSLILMNSVAGMRGVGKTAPYTVAKHGVIGLMRSLVNELSDDESRVNTVHPTAVDTQMIHNPENYRKMLPHLEEPTREDFEKSFAKYNALPVAWVQPSDVANAVLFLASDEAHYVTGVDVDGSLLKAVGERPRIAIGSLELGARVCLELSYRVAVAGSLTLERVDEWLDLAANYDIPAHRGSVLRMPVWPARRPVLRAVKWGSGTLDERRDLVAPSCVLGFQAAERLDQQAALAAILAQPVDFEDQGKKWPQGHAIALVGVALHGRDQALLDPCVKRLVAHAEAVCGVGLRRGLILEGLLKRAMPARAATILMDRAFSRQVSPRS